MKKTRVLAIMLSFLLVAAMFPAQGLAKLKSAGAPTEVSSLISSENLEHNFVKVTAQGSNLHIVCETPIYASRFGINVRSVVPASSKSQWITYAYPENKGDYYRFVADVPATKVQDATYVLSITMPAKTAGKASDMFYKYCNFKVSGGEFSILQYNKVLKENKRVQKSGKKASAYKATNLSDIKNLVFTDPVTKKVNQMTSKKVKYLKKVSNAVVKGANSDYEKTLKIYEYLAEHFYYDDVAFQTKKKQYVDPYRNLYNLRNKKKSANSKGGKVATVCVGYAAAVVALCRAQGIPARVVNGHHVGTGSDRFYNWSTEKKITEVDHWWAEVYVDGRWIVVDPTPGNGNRYNSRSGKWSYTGLTNYIYFDPSPEQLAESYLAFEIKGGK